MNQKELLDHILKELFLLDDDDIQLLHNARIRGLGNMRKLSMTDLDRFLSDGILFVGSYNEFQFFLRYLHVCKPSDSQIESLTCEEWNAMDHTDIERRYALALTLARASILHVNQHKHHGTEETCICATGGSQLQPVGNGKDSSPLPVEPSDIKPRNVKAEQTRAKVDEIALYLNSMFPSVPEETSICATEGSQLQAVGNGKDSSPLPVEPSDIKPKNVAAEQTRAKVDEIALYLNSMYPSVP